MSKFDEYLKSNPNTKHTSETFNAAQFKREELIGEIEVGSIVKVKGEDYQVKITAIYPNWIYGRTNKPQEPVDKNRLSGKGLE
jgi:hypothetical protein